MRFIAMSSLCCYSVSDRNVTTEDLSENLFVTCSYVLNVFLICDTIECDVPDRNVKALPVGSDSRLSLLSKSRSLKVAHDSGTICT